MYSTIIVPLDGSRLAEEALPYALQLAQRLAAEVVLVHVTNSDSIGYTAPDGIDGLSDQALAKRYLNKVCQAIRPPDQSGNDGTPRVSIIVKNGRSADELRDLAVACANPLIVMATHGSGGLRGLVGSVATSLLRKSAHPILLIRHQKRDSPTTLDAILAEPAHHWTGPLVVALDGSPQAEAILAPALALADGLHLPIFLIGVMEPVSPLLVSGMPGQYYTFPTAQDVTSHRSQAEPYLKTVQATILEKGVACMYVERVGHIAEQIAEYAAHEGATAVALTTHGHRPVARIILGSVADDVLRRTHQPVLMLHRHGETPQDDPQSPV